MAEISAFEKLKKREERAWLGRGKWDKLYADAYEFAIPQRRPGGQTRSATQLERVYDMSAIVSTFHFAGTLQQDLFPAGQPNFQLVPGALVKAQLQADELKLLRRRLNQTSKLVHPFFETGEWTDAVFECCLDLAVGTGHIHFAKGTKDQPVRFVSIPAEDMALELGPYGDVTGQFWRQRLPRETIHGQFRDDGGTFPAEFLSRLRTDPYGEVILHQTFYRLPDGRWKFCAFVEESKTTIVENVFRTRRIASPRYYRVPGEAYGRGPVLLAMPSIKTLNRAQELALKAAAIQMLGIWGYRAGGTFNPDTVRVGPGEFWPMMATGGVLGADVQRLDREGGRLDVARMVTEGLQQQIRDVLLDTRLPDPTGTPASASEIVGRLRQKREAHLGAFGRLTREIVPVGVPAAMDILHGFGFLPQFMPIDDLLIGIEVLSPMAQQLKADRITPILSYFEIIAATAGPKMAEVYLHLERALDLIAEDTQVPEDVRPTPNERQAAKQAIQQADQAAAVAQFAMTAMGQKPQKAA